jgi:hypothetical protein
VVVVPRLAGTFLVGNDPDEALISTKASRNSHTANKILVMALKKFVVVMAQCFRVVSHDGNIFDPFRHSDQ